jgi:hypothetical protein
MTVYGYVVYVDKMRFFFYNGLAIIQFVMRSSYPPPRCALFRPNINSIPTTLRQTVPVFFIHLFVVW